MREVELRDARDEDLADVMALYAEFRAFHVAGVPDRLRPMPSLAEAAQERTRARGASELRLETREFAAGPLPFYEALGYRTIKRTLVRPLR